MTLDKSSRLQLGLLLAMPAMVAVLAFGAGEHVASACRFVHDRVQEAALRLLPAAEAPAVHLRLARLLTAVWVGHDDPRATLGPHDDGAHAALPLWVRLVRLAEGDRPGGAVPHPRSHQLPSARTPSRRGRR